LAIYNEEDAVRQLRWVVLAPVAVTLYVAPADARASSVFSDVHFDFEQQSVGRATFTAARGEKNRLTVRVGRWGVVFHDAGSRVQVRGRCKSLGPHTATCRSSGYLFPLRVGGRNDRVKVGASVFATVYGGRGDDRLTGESGVLRGGAGDDVLRGGAGDDLLNGGPGRDRLFGAGGDDTLVDGESDAQAAPDVFDGGASSFYGDRVDFRLRSQPLRVALGRGRTNMGDSVIRVESVTGGSGNDRLTGDGAANRLFGGPGADTIRGGAGTDFTMGGVGNDRLFGGAGDDGMEGGAGQDQLDGGAGNDGFASNEAHVGGTATPDKVACGDGFDGGASDPSDTLEPTCEQLWTDFARIGTAPALRDDHADFTVACFSGTRCAATLRLRSLSGEEYGEANFDVPSLDMATTTVSVPLSAPGVAALRTGTIMRVDVLPSGSEGDVYPGYRMFLRDG